MSVKIVFRSSIPTETTGTSTVKGSKITAAENDQTLRNIQVALDGKMPLAGSAGQAVTVGALTATAIALGTGVSARKFELYGSGSGVGAAYGFGIQTDTLRYYVPSGVSNGVHRFGGLSLADGTTFTEYASISNTGIAVTGVLTAIGAIITTAGTANMKIAATGGTYRSYITIATTVDKWDIGTNVNAADDALQVRYEGGATLFSLAPATGVCKISSLAGAGTRSVVVDANGVLSAP